jgi:hypothetical protein
MDVDHLRNDEYNKSITKGKSEWLDILDRSVNYAGEKVKNYSLRESVVSHLSVHLSDVDIPLEFMGKVFNTVGDGNQITIASYGQSRKHAVFMGS